MIENRQGCKGFTLVEVLVSMGLAALIMMLLLSLVGAGSEGYAAANRDVQARTEGRGALHFIEKDFRSRVRGRIWTPEDAVEGTVFPSDAMGFLCFKSQASQEAGKDGGEVCFVRYYTSVTADGVGLVSRKLFRQFLSSAEVFPLLAEEANIPFPAPPTDEAKDEIIALNVLQFKLRFLARNEAGEQWDVKAWEAAQMTRPATEGEDFSPDMMEMTLRIVDHDVARRMTTTAAWDDSSIFGTESAPKAEAPMTTFKTQISLR